MRRLACPMEGVNPVPDEERRADVLLELADLRAQRRLREEQPSRGPTEVQLLGDGHEVAQ
jgi:hypothetical protein